MVNHTSKVFRVEMSVSGKVIVYTKADNLGDAQKNALDELFKVEMGINNKNDVNIRAHLDTDKRPKVTAFFTRED